MKSALDLSGVSKLSTELLTSLDEAVFFGKVTDFVKDHFEEYKVLAYRAYADGSTQLVADNGEEIEGSQLLEKGKGLSGYVTRTKRAYYSNSQRDPLLATTVRDECVQSELCVPINCEGTILGTIHIQSIKEDRKFSEDDIQSVMEILSHLENSLKNMRLYLIAKNLNKELQQKIEEKEKELKNRTVIASKKDENIADIELIGRSEAMRELLLKCEKVAKEDFPVLLVGNSGTGKKLLARKIHNMSERKNAECINVHCGALTEQQLDQELFGTERNIGVIERANGGTVVLNNVGEMPISIQSKILRVILTGELFRLDSNIPMAVNIRFISTIKNDLNKNVEEGTFKEELFYRLNIMNMKVPSLRERKEDIKLLSEHFINNSNSQDAKVLTNKAVEKLSSYGWPGNIHELKNMMERLAILVSDQFIDEGHLPNLEAEVEEVQVEETIEDFSEMSLHELERLHICRTLDHLSGNKTKAAKSLGITVKTLYNKLHSYGLVNSRTE